MGAIKSFDDPEEVLFLVDLWGGTPFNQANNLVEQHKHLHVLQEELPQRSCSYAIYHAQRCRKQR